MKKSKICVMLLCSCILMNACSKQSVGIKESFVLETKDTMLEQMSDIATESILELEESTEILDGGENEEIPVFHTLEVEEGSYIDQFLNNEYSVSIGENFCMPESFYSQEECKFNDVVFEGTFEEIKAQFEKKTSAKEIHIECSLHEYTSGEIGLLLCLADFSSHYFKSIYMIQNEKELFIAFQSAEDKDNIFEISCYHDGLLKITTWFGIPALVDVYYYVAPDGTMKKLAEYTDSFINVEEDPLRFLKYEKYIWCYYDISWEVHSLVIDSTQYYFVTYTSNEEEDMELRKKIEKIFCNDGTLIEQEDMDRYINEYAQIWGCNYSDSKEYGEIWNYVYFIQ